MIKKDQRLIQAMGVKEDNKFREYNFKSISLKMQVHIFLILFRFLLKVNNQIFALLIMLNWLIKNDY